MWPNYYCQVGELPVQLIQHDTVRQAATEYVEEFIWNPLDPPTELWTDHVVFNDGKVGVFVKVMNEDKTKTYTIFVTPTIEFETKIISID